MSNKTFPVDAWYTVKQNQSLLWTHAWYTMEQTPGSPVNVWMINCDTIPGSPVDAWYTVKWIYIWHTMKQPGSPALGRGFYRAHWLPWEKVLCQLGVLLEMVLFLTDGSAQLQREITPAWIWGCAENYLRMFGGKKKKTEIAVCFLTKDILLKSKC